MISVKSSYGDTGKSQVLTSQIFMGYSQCITTNPRPEVWNGYHMFACLTGIDDITAFENMAGNSF